jgi:hypothetical protein
MTTLTILVEEHELYGFSLRTFLKRMNMLLQISKVTNYTNFGHCTLGGNLNKNLAYIHQVKRTVATLLPAWQIVPSGFC